MRTNHIKDSYHAQVWISGDIAAWLNSKFPDDELGLQIAQLLQHCYESDRESQRSQPASLLRLIDKPTHPSQQRQQRNTKPQPEPEPIEPKPITVPPLTPHQRRMLESARTASPVAWVNQFCQKIRITAPDFECVEVLGGFKCTVSLFDRHAEALGGNKKEAKNLAATALLEKLQH